MPTLRGIEAHVTTLDGKPLEEWGVQSFRRSGFSSCYIVAQTQMAFRVSLRPQIPYVAPDVASSNAARRRGYTEPGLFEMPDDWTEDCEGPLYLMRTCWYQRVLSLSSRLTDELVEDTRMQITPQRSLRENLGGRQTSYEKWTDYRRQQPLKSTCSSAHQHGAKRNVNGGTPPPDFHMLATLYIDGRRTPERRVIIYLDPNNEDFRDDGRVTFKSRWVEGSDGQLREYHWVFNEVGIETLFDRMLILGEIQTREKVPAREEDGLIAAMDKISLDQRGESADDANGVGQIKIELRRVRLGEVWEDYDYRAYHKESDAEDMAADGAAELSHVTGLAAAKKIKSKSIRVVSHRPFKEGEPVYATFTFMYRSRENLQKFWFPGFPQPDVKPFKHRKRHGPKSKRFKKALQLHTLTPLILQDVTKKAQKRIDAASAFEEKVKYGKASKWIAPEVDFGGHYREVSDDFELDGESSSLPRRDEHGKSARKLDDASGPSSTSSPQLLISDGRPPDPPSVSTNLGLKPRPMQPGHLRKHHSPNSSPSDREDKINLASAADKENFLLPAHLRQPNYDYRHGSPESDADDEERAKSGVHADDMSSDEISIHEDEHDSIDLVQRGRAKGTKRQRGDGDDQGLGAALKKVSLGKRTRGDGDADPEAQIGEAGNAGNPSRAPLASMRESSSGSAPMEGSDSEDAGADVGSDTAEPGGTPDSAGHAEDDEGSVSKRKRVKVVEE